MSQRSPGTLAALLGTNLDLATEVRTVASDHYDQPVRVRLLTRIEIDTDPIK